MSGSGYKDCACRDCFDIAIGDAGKTALCLECQDAACSIDGDSECQRLDAYGAEGEEE